VKQVIKGVHIVPMGFANAFLIDGDNELTLIDADFAGKESTVFGAIRGLGRSSDQLKHLVFTHVHPDHIGSAAAIVVGLGWVDMESSSSRGSSRSATDARQTWDVVCGREVATRLRRPRAGARDNWVLLERKGISVKRGPTSRSRCDSTILLLLGTSSCGSL
jgi:glyoxylase-like metal-dependent hydrolase (beta-lactamase superfamily II)